MREIKPILCRLGTELTPAVCGYGRILKQVVFLVKKTGRCLARVFS